MPWTTDEIWKNWLGGSRVSLNIFEIVRAFNHVEEILGREWVDACRWHLGQMEQGAAVTLRVAMIGKELMSVAGAGGLADLVERLRAGDTAAASELTAAYLLTSGREDTTEIEFAPVVDVDGGPRVPDFRIRTESDPWTYVEVSRALDSDASEQARALLHRLSAGGLTIARSFALEVVLWRDPTPDDERRLIEHIAVLAQRDGVVREDVNGLASLFLNHSAPAEIIPQPADGQPRAAYAAVVGGGSQPQRQITVRLPFVDQRAETILTAEARQLPRGGPGLVIVDVRRQPTALDAWEPLVLRRFGPTQHTRVSGISMFMPSMITTDAGYTIRPLIKLITNPHASTALPSWIIAAIDEIRAENRRLMQRPD